MTFYKYTGECQASILDLNHCTTEPSCLSSAGTSQKLNEFLGNHSIATKKEEKKESDD